MADQPMKACPFCGGREIDHNHHESAGQPMYCAHCQKCGAEGPLADDATYATLLWNTRAEWSSLPTDRSA